MAGRWLKKAEGTWRRLGALGCSGKLCFFPMNSSILPLLPLASTTTVLLLVVQKNGQPTGVVPVSCVKCTHSQCVENIEDLYTEQYVGEGWRGWIESGRKFMKHPVAVAVAWPDDEDSPHLIRCCCCSRGISHQGLTVMHDMKCCWEYCWDLCIYTWNITICM